MHNKLPVGSVIAFEELSKLIKLYLLVVSA